MVLSAKIARLRIARPAREATSLGYPLMVQDSATNWMGSDTNRSYATRQHQFDSPVIKRPY